MICVVFSGRGCYKTSLDSAERVLRKPRSLELESNTNGQG
jgi:hypothetical protein